MIQRTFHECAGGNRTKYEVGSMTYSESGSSRGEQVGEQVVQGVLPVFCFPGARYCFLLFSCEAVLVFLFFPVFLVIFSAPQSGGGNSKIHLASEKMV